MNDRFFNEPILNSPYELPTQHWELDEERQPTGKIIKSRRSAEFITPIPKPKRRKHASSSQLTLDTGTALIDASQDYDATSNINQIRVEVDRWRDDPNVSNWQVTHETARLLQHWRGDHFTGTRPFFCQVEAVGDDADLEEIYDSERHLLYVACTRARERLLVSGVTPISEFADDLTS